MLLTSLIAAAALTTSVSSALPRFEKTPCPAEVANDEAVDCGRLFVPENRRAAHSRTIALPVIIFRSRAAKPALDPILFLTGGPGLSTTSNKKSGKGNPFLDTRDQIYLEPRGAALSSTPLECPEYGAARLEIDSGRAPDATPLLTAAASACYKRMTAQGIDLNGYTTAETADDIADLKRVLNLAPVNLYGLSYGTRLALETLSRHPDAVRSVILDSTLAPEVNFDESATANLRRSLNLVFDGCATDPACAAAYPDLRKTFYDLVARADATPLPVGAPDAKGGAIIVRGAQVTGLVYDTLHNPGAIASIPRLISDAAAGHYDGLKAGLQGMGPSGYTWGLRLSVWCADEAPFETSAAPRVSAEFGNVDEGTVPAGLCQAWPVAPSHASENQPVINADVPVLIFAGEYDPDTPPDWGRRQLSGLGKARFVLMPGQSHGASFNACGGQISLAFVADPSALLPLDCVARLRGADFAKAAVASK